MHILYLSVPGGGLETNVRVLAPALVQAGHEVSILYLDAAGRALTETVLKVEHLNVQAEMSRIISETTV